MKTRFSRGARILFCVLVALVAVLAFAGPQPCACGQDEATAFKAGPDGDPEAAPALTPDTVLVKLQTDPNDPPIELTVKQFMEKYRIPGLSIAVIDNYRVAWAKGFSVTAPG